VRALLAEATPRLANFSPYDLVQLGRHSAVLVHRRLVPPQTKLFAEMSKVAIPTLHQCGERELSQLAWAFGRSQPDAHAFFDALALEVGGRLVEFQPRGLSAIAWSFSQAWRAAARDEADGKASLGRWRPALDALSEEIAGRVGSLSIKEAQSIEQSFCVMKRRSPFSGEKVTRVHAGDGGGVTPLYT